MTQNDLILNALGHGWLTPADALKDYGCFRLAARIRDLRDVGIEIEDEWVWVKNRAGQEVRVKRYRRK